MKVCQGLSDNEGIKTELLTYRAILYLYAFRAYSTPNEEQRRAHTDMATPVRRRSTEDTHMPPGR